MNIKYKGKGTLEETRNIILGSRKSFWINYDPPKFILNGNVLDFSTLPENLKELLQELLKTCLRQAQDGEDTQQDQNHYYSTKNINNTQALMLLWISLFPQKNTPQQHSRIISLIQRDINTSITQFQLSNQNQIDIQINSLINQRQQIKQQIHQQFNQIKNTMQLQIITNEDLKWLKTKIWMHQKDLFQLSIAAIRQLHHESDRYKYNLQVHVYFQQSYPVKLMLSNDLKKIIGENSYREKVAAMPKISVTETIDQYNTIVSCHYCTRILTPTDKFYQCSAKLNEQNLKPTHMTDPIMYFRLFHDPFNHQYNANHKSYPHPYTTYYHYTHNYSCMKPICKRVYCAECFEKLIISRSPTLIRKMLSDIPLNKDEQQYICGFCQGWCNCIRCEIADNITKLTSYYVKLGGNISDIVKGFVFPSFKKTKVNKKQIKSIGTYKKIVHKNTIKQKKILKQAMDKLYQLGILRPIKNQHQLLKKIIEKRLIKLEPENKVRFPNNYLLNNRMGQIRYCKDNQMLKTNDDEGYQLNLPKNQKIDMFGDPSYFNFNNTFLDQNGSMNEYRDLNWLSQDDRLEKYEQ